ncbi:MAG: hypothetical protein LUP94_01065 [Candidatus Methanomethylicus sp.]|nr:hypothetical protein [Candidatus Methanomethylicus sp.]
MEAKVIVEAEVRPTEDEQKVAKSITNLTGSNSFKRIQQGRRLYLIQEGGEALLLQLRSMLRRERILDAARKVMTRGMDEEESKISFCLNKQVALSNHLSFCSREGESPMGPISFTVVSKDPKSLIEWLATRTFDGTPVDELCQSGFPHSAHSERHSKH